MAPKDTKGQPPPPTLHWFQPPTTTHQSFCFQNLWHFLSQTIIINIFCLLFNFNYYRWQRKCFSGSGFGQRSGRFDRRWTKQNSHARKKFHFQQFKLFPGIWFRHWWNNWSRKMTFAEQIFKSELVGSVLLISSTLAFVSRQPQLKSLRGSKFSSFVF